MIDFECLAGLARPIGATPEENSAVAWYLQVGIICF